MKVVFCAYDRPNYVGGPNAGLRRLLPALRAQGVDARAWFLTFGEAAGWSTIPDLERNGVPVRHAPYQATTEERVRRLVQWLREDPPDVFVPNLMPAAYFAARWAREAGIPAVAVLRSDDAFHHGLLDCFLAGSPRDRMDAAVCVSEYLCGRVRERVPAGFPVVQIPSSVDLPARSVEPPGEGPLRLVYSGRLVETQKRVSAVARAFCRAAREVPGVEGVLYGDGPARPEVERILAEEGAGLPVRLAGRVDSGHMQEELLQGHVIVLLSEYEGLPMGLMEGMACGLAPVCLPTRSGVPELLEHGRTGLLLEDDQEAFVQAVRRLRRDQDCWRALSQGARERIASAYTGEHGLRRWIDLLQQLRRDSGPRRPVAMPLRLDLPPAHPGLAREDTRADARTAFRAAVQSLVPGASARDPLEAFLSPRCTPGRLDLYTVRRGILAALERALPHFSGVLLDVGAGVAPYRRLILERTPVTRYLSLDLADNPYSPPDVVWDGRNLPLADGTVDCALATEVLEHCPAPGVLLAETRRVLKPGGALFLTVPFLWPLHDLPHDEFRYTPWSLRRLLQEAGFASVDLGSLGGYEAALAQMLGLFVRRRSRGRGYRRLARPLLAALAAPLVWGLTRLDRPPSEFREGQMITGLWALARAGGTS